VYRYSALPCVYHHEAVDDACSADLSWTMGLMAWVTAGRCTLTPPDP
jgi:hypothetical protein